MTDITKRAIPAARDLPNRASVEGLRSAVNELTGAVGSTAQRAVRVCELVDAGLLEVKNGGTLGRPSTSYYAGGDIFSYNNLGTVYLGDKFYRRPRIFTDATDPGTAADEGDLWIYNGAGTKRRTNGAWIAC